MKLFLPLIVAIVNAQVVFRAGKLRRSSAAVVDFSTVLLSHVRETPAASFVPATDGVYKFGGSIPVDVNTETHGKWSVENGVKVWRVKIQSDSAKTLSVQMSKFKMTATSELYVTDSQGSVMGPYTYANNKQSLKFATMPVATEWLLLELYIAANDYAKPLLQIGSVVHGFQDVLRKSGKCNINAPCEMLDWDAPMRSVAMMLTEDGTGYCSGAMLNNARGDGRQLFLTAYHCVRHSDVSNNMLLFNY